MDAFPCAKIIPNHASKEAEIPPFGRDELGKQVFDLDQLSNYYVGRSNGLQASDDVFQRILEAQLSCVRSCILNEHNRQVSELRAEVEKLQSELLQVAVAEVSTPMVSEMQVENGEEKKMKNCIEEPISEHEVSRTSMMGKKFSLKLLTKKKKKKVDSKEVDRTKRLYDRDTSPSKPKLRRRSSGDLADVDLDMVQKIVQSSWFEMCSGAVIMANTIIIALQMQYDGFDSGFSLKVPGMHGTAKETWPGAEIAFLACNITFNALFTIELVLRVGALKRRSIRSCWIWFDAVIVGVGITDIVAQDALAFNPGMMRVLRLFRLVRLLKVFQAMSSFDSLFLLLKAIHASREALVWSFMILGLVQLIVGLFLCQVLQEITADESQPIETRQTAFKYFGTFSRTMLTMFEITMANWVVSARALIDDVSELFILFFILYRCMFCFAILRVIAAVFITETNRVLEHDDELTIMKRNREKTLFQAKLNATFRAMDPHGRGRFGWKELDALMGDTELLNLVTTLGFDVHDFEKLFWLLDDGSGEISIHEFISKMGKLKGQSKTIDMLTMLKLTHRIDQKIQTVFEKQGLLERNELEVAEEDLACRV